MSLPFEQTRSMARTRQFLLDLCVPGKIKRIPREVRHTARCLVKHFPSSWDLPRMVKDQFAMRQMESQEDEYRKEFWSEIRE